MTTSATAGRDLVGNNLNYCKLLWGVLEVKHKVSLSQQIGPMW